MSRADGDVKPAAMASMAASVSVVAGCWLATCLREKSARKRRASGVVSEVRVWRRDETEEEVEDVGSEVTSVGGTGIEVEEEVILLIGLSFSARTEFGCVA